MPCCYCGVGATSRRAAGYSVSCGSSGPALSTPVNENGCSCCRKIGRYYVEHGFVVQQKVFEFLTLPCMPCDQRSQRPEIGCTKIDVGWKQERRYWLFRLRVSPFKKTNVMRRVIDRSVRRLLPVAGEVRCCPSSIRPFFQRTWAEHSRRIRHNIHPKCNCCDWTWGSSANQVCKKKKSPADSRRPGEGGNADDICSCECAPYSTKIASQVVMVIVRFVYLGNMCIT